MTAQPERIEIPHVDPGHPWIGPGPAALSVFGANAAGQRYVGLTLRGPGATLTVMIDRDTALAWARDLNTAALQLGGLIVPNGAAMPIPLSAP